MVLYVKINSTFALEVSFVYDAEAELWSDGNSALGLHVIFRGVCAAAFKTPQLIRNHGLWISIICFLSLEAELSRYAISVQRRSWPRALGVMKQDDGEKASEGRRVHAVGSRWCKMQLGPQGICKHFWKGAVRLLGDAQGEVKREEEKKRTCWTPAASR